MEKLYTLKDDLSYLEFTLKLFRNGIRKERLGVLGL